MLWTLTGEQYSLLSLQCPVHRYPFSFDNSKVCSRSCLLSTRIPRLNVNQKQRCLKSENVISKVENYLICADMGQYYRLQKMQNGCIVPSQKNSGNRSCTLAMTWVGNSSTCATEYINSLRWEDWVRIVLPISSPLKLPNGGWSDR